MSKTKTRKDILRMNICNIEPEEQDRIRTIFKDNYINLNGFVKKKIYEKIEELEFEDGSKR